MNQPLEYASQSDIDTYRDDGIVCLRGVFEQKWLDLIHLAWTRVEYKLQNAQPVYAHMTPFLDDDPLLQSELAKLDASETAAAAVGKGFLGAKWMYLHDRDMQTFVKESPAAQIVGEVLDVDSIRFFWDQMFVKKANVGQPTYWHTDMPAWPMRGTQIPSFWIPLKPVDKKLSSLEFVKGSHLTYEEKDWPRSFNASQLERPANRSDFKDIEALRSTGSVEILSYDMQPGDALLFDPRLYHGGGANNHPTQDRVALSTRWVGPDVTWDPRPECLNVPGWPHDKMPRGERVADKDLIPMVWSRKTIVA